MKKWAICLGLSIVFALCGIATAYDDFSTPLLDPDKWSTYEYSRTHLASGKLLSLARSTQQDEYTQPWFSFVNPSSISSIKSEVMIQQVSVTQNTNNNALAEVRIHGFFYSTVASSTEFTGNVWAELSIADRGNGLEAYWRVRELLDNQGDMFNVLGEDTLIAPGTLNTGTVYILELEYDEPQNQFRFAVYDQTDMVLASGQLIFSNRMGPPYNPWVNMGSIAFNDLALISATFDNVYTKSSPSDDYTLYDDCSTYNTANWMEPQIERAISDGKYVSVAQSTGNRETNDLKFTGTPDHIEAKVSISSDSAIPADGDGHARINGYFFNDTKPPELQTGYAGNVWAQVWLQVRGNDVVGRCYVGKSLSDDEAQWEDIWDRYFDQLTLSLDTTYTLSLEFTGVSLVFKISDGLNSQSHTYMIPDGTPVYDEFGEFRSLRTRAYGSGGGGTIKATFDDVRTDSDVFPHIRANNSDGAIDLPSGEILSVTIELDPGDYSGVAADWWCLADTPFGWYYYNAGTEGWLPGFMVSYQGPLFELTPPSEVLNTSDLPIGGYRFYFGVDGNRNGNLDEPLYYDSIEVNILP